MELKIHIPMDDKYVTLLGKAVYSFSYYEWTIIYIINHFNNSFVSRYCREKTLTSGQVLKEFEKATENNNDTKLLKCKNDFSGLIDERNALIHGHPCTSGNGKQVLNYQSSTEKIIHDLLWDFDKVIDFIYKVDKAEIEAVRVLDSFRQKK